MGVPPHPSPLPKFGAVRDPALVHIDGDELMRFIMKLMKITII